MSNISSYAMLYKYLKNPVFIHRWNTEPIHPPKNMRHYENLSLKFNLSTQLRGYNTQKVGTLSQQGDARYQNELHRCYTQLQGRAGNSNGELT